MFMQLFVLEHVQLKDYFSVLFVVVLVAPNLSNAVTLNGIIKK